MSRAARTTLELSLNPNYVKTWGAWEAIRELLQNAQDADDMGHSATVEYITNTKLPMLRITTDGITINRDTLLLGTTSKDNDPRQRGQFGEGFKLAWLVLSRMGLQVRCRSGEEQWAPRIGHSDQFGAEVLMVDTSPMRYRNAIQVDVIGLSGSDWEEIRNRCLFLTKLKKNEMIDLGRDRILTSEDKIGTLYVKGIYVGRLPGKYFYGYDFDNVELDRDRRLADPWSLKYAIKEVLESALVADKIKDSDVWQLLQNNDWDECRAIKDGIYGRSAITKRMSAMFQEKYGKDALPVTDTTDTVEAKHYGLKGVAVGVTLRAVIEQEVGRFEDKRQERSMEASTLYSVDDLTEEEGLNFLWALDLVKLCGHHNNTTITIVDFFSDTLHGTWNEGGQQVRLSRKVMNDRVALVSTLIHELAHRGELEDGTVEHRDACDNLFARIIAAQ